MSHIRHLAADLYFCDMSRLYDGSFLSDVFEKVLKRWNRANWRIVLFPVSDGGWAGMCISAQARLTYQTFPSVDFMALEILTVGTVVDPRSLGEQVVSELEPSLVKFEMMTRGEHLPLLDG